MHATDEYLQATPVLDYHHPAIQHLIASRGWRELEAFHAIGAVHDFVRDEIPFGYNSGDDLRASRVLRDGYGQCNTKGTLLMALLRALSIPARFHAFTIHNDLQRGAIPDYLFRFAPQKIIHSWVEVQLDGRWIALEGYIIDSRYLSQIQKRFGDYIDAFHGYGVATSCLKKPPNVWIGEDTYIQQQGIADDLGIYARPDDFYGETGGNLSGAKRILYRFLLRHLINLNVKRIRQFGP